MLNGAAEQQCRFWLVDARRRDNGTNGQNVSWMMDTFFPQMVARLGQPVFIAYLFAPSHLHDIIADPAIPSLSYFDNRPYRVERFIEERTALEWLASCQTVVAAR